MADRLFYIKVKLSKRFSMLNVRGKLEQFKSVALAEVTGRLEREIQIDVDTEFAISDPTPPH